MAAVLCLLATAGWSSGADAPPQSRVSSPAPPPPTGPTGGQPSSPADEFGTFDGARFSTPSTSHYYLSSRPPPESEAFYFPPDPPPLGAPLRLLRPPATGRRAPPELAGFVDEPFYPILGLRLAAEDLPKQLQREVDAYRAAKLALQDELRAALARLQEADGAARRDELASLARDQVPRIAALEATADRLRSRLRRSGVYGSIAGHGDWNEDRTWRLRPGTAGLPAPNAPRDEFEVIRAAAFFQDGLSPAQRRLVRELAMELQAEIARPGAPPAGARDDGTVFFLPATARIQLPGNLPASLAAKVAALVAMQQDLKAELRRALVDVDGRSGDERVQALAQLAAKQTPRIEAAEALAEEIRADLAGIPDLPGPPAPVRLPAELEARISTYREHKLELVKELHARLVQGDAGGRPQAGTTGLAEQAAALNRQYAPRFEELNAEKGGIRAALAEYTRATGGGRGQKSVDDLLTEFENSRQQQEVWEQYRDYRDAVLTPGLAPAQRRLLFDAALERLGLPLPAGELPR